MTKRIENLKSSEARYIRILEAAELALASSFTLTQTKNAIKKAVHARRALIQIRIALTSKRFMPSPR